MSDKYVPYREKYDRKQSIQLAERIKELPAFLEEFMLYMKDDVEAAVSTRLAYALDLKIFFTFLKEYLPEYADTPMRDIPAASLDKMKLSDIRYFIRTYLNEYENQDGVVRQNARNGRARKLAVLKKMYHYYLNTDNPDTLIHTDPASAVTIKKVKSNPIKYLESDQVADLLDTVEEGNGAEFSARQGKWNKKSSLRDTAIFSLLLGTGMRVSECVGINLQDIDLENASINIRRKGNKEDTIYLTDEVLKALKDYMDNERLSYKPTPDAADALFLSRAHERITVRSVERMVKKYTQVVTGTDEYTPHKMRSTFATLLLAGEDGTGEDGASLKEIQDALGHSSPSTTSKFYVKVMEESKRKTFNKMKLRET